jgi:hypothetical protein
MRALLEREARPGETCSNCNRDLGRWRCRDCMFPTIQCRKCIRQQHYHEPLHRIECWTGKFFRPAAMWEVGGYMLIRHHGETGLCATLKFQKDILDDIQERQDVIDQETCRVRSAAEQEPINIPDPSDIENNEHQFTDDTSTENLILKEMDRLHSQGYSDEEGEILLEDDEEDRDQDCTEEASKGFKDYLQSNANIDKRGPPAHRAASASDIDDGSTAAGADDIHFSTIPKKDAFNNHYVRIAHTNGIHHLAVVTCNCRGEDQIPIDLMNSRLVPTSFSIIRTLFTTMALDTFRLANLEMKASAYQYFQFLHRLTLKITSNVPNLYAELRKVSRAWRWMKKLKWAGFGCKTADATAPAAGELTLFCPACPQPGINLPTDWKGDENRYF